MRDWPIERRKKLTLMLNPPLWIVLLHQANMIHLSLLQGNAWYPGRGPITSVILMLLLPVSATGPEGEIELGHPSPSRWRIVSPYPFAEVWVT